MADSRHVRARVSAQVSIGGLTTAVWQNVLAGAADSRHGKLGVPSGGEAAARVECGQMNALEPEKRHCDVRPARDMVL